MTHPCAHRTEPLRVLMWWRRLAVRPDLELPGALVLPDLPREQSGRGAAAAALTASGADVAYVPWRCRKHRLVSDQLMLLPAKATRRGGRTPPSRLADAYEPRTLQRYAWDAASPSSLYPERLAWHALEGLELRLLRGGATGVSLLAEGPAHALGSGTRLMRRDAYAKLRADFPGCFADG